MARRPMKMTGGDIVKRALEDESVPFTFGIPGTHNIELYDALARSPSVRPILVTDEQSASFMADGVSRTSGQLGCVNVVPGAGLTHALSGIAEAFMDGIPLLVLGCGVRADTGAAFQLHDVDQMAIVAPVTKAQLRPAKGSELYAAIRQACRIARTPPAGPVFVEVPVDQYLFRHDPGIDAWTDPPSEPRLPDPKELDRVRDLLAGARRPLLYIGAGAQAAGAELIALAERLEAPVATTIQGKGVFPESHPLWLWPGFGAAAPPFVRSIARSCDLTLAIGCRFSEVGTASYGLEPPGSLVHVDVDESVFNRNYPAELAVAADAGAFVTALLQGLEARPEDPGLRAAIHDGHQTVWSGWSKQAGEARVPPHHLLKTLQDVYGPDAIFTTDSGNGTFLAMECLRLDAPRSFLAPVDYSCMGYSVPAAIGAGLACPERRAVALAGDGAFLMTGLELLTAGQLKVPVTVILLRDRELAQIAQFQQTAMARKTASRLPDFDTEALARGLGVEYLHLATGAAVEDVLRDARSAHDDGRPVLVETEIDYSAATYFTRGVVRTNLGRLPWPDRLRFVARALTRRFSEGPF
ncbi:MAG TPA: thiamine pyrophosphate-binding protein [Gemmatimonadota bacterium]|nr:thiamine pyrophosphate-binding protein [Gemmatimonadota bacterium]